MPDDERAGYSPTLVDAIRVSVSKFPNRSACIFLTEGEEEGERLTYTEVDAGACAIGARLQQSVAPGQRALLLHPPGLDFVLAFLGCLYSGLVAVPVYPPRKRTLPHLLSIVRDVRPALALTLSANLAKLTSLCSGEPELAGLGWLATDQPVDEPLERAEGTWAPSPLRGESPAFVQYTSGSTARPKGVVVSHANLVHNEEMIRRAFGQSPDSVVVGWLPHYHDMGLIGNLLQPLTLGASSILMSPMAFLNKPLRWLEAITRYRATTSGGPDFAYELATRKISAADRKKLDLESWQVAFNGAEPVRASTLDAFSAAFAAGGFRREAFYPCYGLAEATLFVSGGSIDEAPGVGAFDAAALEELRVRPVPSEADGPVERAAIRKLVSCGRPWSGQQLVIVDPRSRRRCAPDRTGEIWVRGPSVAQGYWQRPEESEEMFRACLQDEPGAGRFLRTGDLGFVHGGELFITGRLKDLIILRGRNYHPHDIEQTVERAHNALRVGCGAAFSVEVEDEERLVVAWELARHSGTPAPSVAEAVRRAVSQEHELRVHEVVLLRAATIPKTSSGKIRRHACRAEYLSGRLRIVGRRTWDTAPELVEAAATPADRTEKASPSRQEISQLAPDERLPVLLAELRRQVARATLTPAEGISADEPLVGLGLDSLAAVELKQSLEAWLGVGVSLGDLLDGIDLAGLARDLLSRLERDACEGVLPWPKEASSSGELSYGQKALWFLHRLAPESAAYHIVAAARVRPALDLEAWRRAFGALVERHPALRTTFHTVGGEPRRRVHSELAPEFLVEDVSALADDALRARLEAEAYRPFDPQTGSLVRTAVFRRSSGQDVVLLALHHLVADFWSLAVLTRELGIFYRRAAVSAADADAGVGAPVRAPEPLRTTYGEYVSWQKELIQGPRGEALWRYWREQLAGELPVPDLPTDRPRPPVPTYEGAARSLRLGAELSRDLKSLAGTRGCTIFMALLAGFQALLSRYTGQDDLLVGCPTTGRGRAELAELVGYFVNPVVVRADLSGDPSFQELLVRVRRRVVGAFEHQDHPFPLLAERLQPEREASRSAVFQVMFVLHKAPRPEERSLAAFAVGEAGAELALGDLRIESMGLAERAAQLDLTLRVAEIGEQLVASLQYATELFDDATMRRFLGHFKTLLGAVPGAHRQVSQLPLLAAAERAQLFAEWNSTRASRVPDLCLQELFEAQVERTPDTIAMVWETNAVWETDAVREAAATESRHGVRLTYRELNARANRLAHHLRRAGVGPEVRIGVCLARSPRMLVGTLAILKAGGAYVPLDPSYPSRRLGFMLDDSGARMLLARRALPDTGARTPRVVVIDPRRESVGRESSENPARASRPRNLAYVIYTSGSTGRPKGVAIEHRSTVDLVRWSRQVFSREELAGVLASTSMGFDLSLFELFVPWSRGGKVILAENALELPRLAAREEVTLVNTVPSAMAILSSMPLPAALRTVNLAGEALSPQLAAQVRRHGQVKRLLNLYGPSEDTTYSTFASIEAGERVTIGRPVTSCQVRLLDRHARPVPIGVSGELHLGGAGLARGYLDRPALTAERFLPHAFAAAPGARLYRTGDLARYLPSGELVFLGRIDHQVKLRGFRIELGEIETVLAELPAVRAAAVIEVGSRSGGNPAGGGESGPERLAAFVVAAPDAAPAGGELRGLLEAELEEKLPRYMVPAHFLVLESLPLTPNGKIDRQQLGRHFSRALTRSAGRQEGPKTPTEELIAGAWCQLLGLERVGSHDHFFELGGHSLLATQMISRVQSIFGVELPLPTVFAAPRLSELARRVDEARGAGRRVPRVPLVRVAREGGLELSFSQLRLWFLDQLEPGTPAYDLRFSIRLRGLLEAAVLASSFRYLAERHEILRTRFEVRGGEPAQVIEELPATPFVVLDLERLPAAQRRSEAERIAARDRRRSFRLHGLPLWRALLLRTGSDEWRLLVSFHHIITDGWSFGVLLRDLAAVYEARLRGRPVPLKELPFQYADYAAWQRGWLRGDVLEEKLTFWRRCLGAGGSPPLELPTDRPRPSVQTSRGALESFRPSLDLVAGLTALGRREGATPFMVLLAAFDTLLFRYSQQDDISVGTYIAGRVREELESMLGFFVNTLVLRVDISGDPPFSRLLERARRTTLGAYSHQEVPFEKILEKLEVERDLSRTPLFQVMLVLQNLPSVPAALPGVTLEIEDGGVRERANFDLTLWFSESSDGLQGLLEYNVDLFDSTAVRRLADHFLVLLSGLLENPSGRLSELPLLGAEEERQVLIEWNRAAPCEPGRRRVTQLFEDRAEASPEAVAVDHEARRLSYRELNERANRLAHHLRARGVGPELVVGVCLERSVEMIVAILGVLKAGGAYLPLDPQAPPKRWSYMLEDAAAVQVVTTEELGRGLPAALQAIGVGRTLVDREAAAIASRSVRNPSPLAAPAHLAYVIYTSGSTGRAKAVAVSHRSLVRYTADALASYELAAADRALQFAALTFDASVEEIYPTLAAGSLLVLRSEEMMSSVAEFLDACRRWRITVLNLPTAYWHEVCADPAAMPDPLRLTVIGGETARRDRLVAWRQKVDPTLRLVNTYGPTEATVVATRCQLTPRMRADSEIPIGRAIGCARVYVLDRALRPSGVGIPGALHIAGAGLARGYLGRPGQTAECFVPDPFTKSGGGRLYRSGDRACWRPDGQLDYVGRIDFQLKIRGFRIEPGEIELTLLRHPAVREAVVVADIEDTEAKRLVAYVVAESVAFPATPGALRACLRERLPEYMVPAVFVSLPELPKTAAGKVDRRRLPAPDRSRPELEHAYVAPRTPSEEALAEIAAELLGVERVGVYDSFFDLGGHSLLATRLLSHIRELFQVELPLRAIFETPSIVYLAVTIEEMILAELQEESDMTFQ